MKYFEKCVLYPTINYIVKDLMQINKLPIF